MDRRAQEELVALFRDAMAVGGAAIEMRIRRFASFVRATDGELAQAIAPLVSEPARALRDAGTGKSPVDTDTRLPLLKTDSPDAFRTQPLLSTQIQAAVNLIIREREATDKLLAEGLVPIRSVLMSGPPGVGKTMTAGWLAKQLNLPLLTLDLASVMSSYLGKTGSNVRAVLTHAQERPCVLLLDEFDSIAKRRDDDSDVGELKRLVTVILQTIDDWSPMSLLVAATNHGELLDPAVWRRFDVTLDFALPEKASRFELLRSLDVPEYLAAAMATLTEGQTFSALTRAVDSARKQSILDGRRIEETLADWAAYQGAAPGGPLRLQREQRDLKMLVRHFQHKTTREIAEEFGSSHTTVVRALKKYLGDTDGRT